MCVGVCMCVCGGGVCMCVCHLVQSVGVLVPGLCLGAVAIGLGHSQSCIVVCVGPEVMLSTYAMIGRLSFVLVTVELSGNAI